MKLAGLHKSLRPLLVGVAAAGLAAGLAAGFAGYTDWARSIWTVATLPVLAALLGEIVTSLRRGDLGLDIVAALSMTAALVFGEELAAAVVALMYAGGQYLEIFAERRARREMTALLARVPRDRDASPRRRAGGGAARGDRARRPAADPPRRRGPGRRRGRSKASAVLDESALTGEAMPVRHAVGRGGHERPDERRRRLRPDRRTARGREHLRRHRPAGRAGAAVQGADGAARRPLRHLVSRR